MKDTQLPFHKWPFCHGETCSEALFICCPFGIISVVLCGKSIFTSCNLFAIMPKSNFLFSAQYLTIFLQNAKAVVFVSSP